MQDTNQADEVVYGLEMCLDAAHEAPDDDTFLYERLVETLAKMRDTKTTRGRERIAAIRNTVTEITEVVCNGNGAWSSKVKTCVREMADECEM